MTRAAVSFLPSDVTAEDLGLGTKTPVEITGSIINWALGLLALISVVFILYGGFTWLTSGGNEKQIETAKGVLKAAIIGLVIIMASLGISNYIFAVLINASGATVAS